MVGHHPPAESKTQVPSQSQASVVPSGMSEKAVGCQTLRSQSASSCRAIPSWLMSKSKQQHNVDLEEPDVQSLDSSQEDQPVIK